MLTGPDTGGGEGCEIFILDIDGTLMHTHEIDNRCYWQAIHEVYGFTGSPESLVKFLHVSDSGILQEWCQRALGRDPIEGEITEIRRLFLELIESIADEQPELFKPRPGLEPRLETMTTRVETHLAIATGSWGNTAVFKLEFSGLARFELKLASADDALSRTDIMRAALSRLGIDQAAGHHAITYIGDGPWDLHASRELGWSFIGIADGDRARTLRDLGADRVDADFQRLARHHQA